MCLFLTHLHHLCNNYLICRIKNGNSYAFYLRSSPYPLAATRMAVAKRLEQGAKSGLLWPYNSWKNRIAILRFVQDIPMNPSHLSHDCLKKTERLLYQLRNKPMKICWGMKDWCFDTLFLQQWRERFPEASVTVFPNAGHYILEDAHETVVPMVQDFLKYEDL
jgi:cis-3-alkyl-4-acyloxetan-2-one decarboxylase